MAREDNRIFSPVTINGIFITWGLILFEILVKQSHNVRKISKPLSSFFKEKSVLSDKKVLNK